MYKEKILVLHAKSYEVYDELTRETNRGLTLRYINKGKLVPVSKTVNGTYEGGYGLAKASLTVDFIGKLQSVPGVYEGEFDLAVNSSGKTELKMFDLKFVGNVGLSDITENSENKK